MLSRNGISVYLAIVLVEECISEMVHGYGFYFLGQNNPYSQGRSGVFDGLNIFIKKESGQYITQEGGKFGTRTESSLQIGSADLVVKITG